MILQKNPKSFSLFEKEAKVFELITEHGPCSSMDIANLQNDDLLATMRIIHRLEERGLLVRATIARRKLFMAKPQLKSLKIRTRPRG
jgi:hypothetical protein